MRKICLMFILLLNLVCAYAKVDFNLTVEKMEMNSGKMTLIQAKDVNPGDTLIYTLKVKNDDEGVVKNIMPSIPIPEYTTLIPTYISPSDSYSVSTDGKDYKKYPYLGSDGRPVADSMYKSIRWTVDSMKPNEEKTFKFGVSVN